MKNFRIILLSAFVLLSVSAFSQNETNKNVEPAQTENLIKPWFFGVKGNVPLAKSTFESYSFIDEKIGYGGGLFVGYNFNPIFGVELFGGYSNVYLGHHASCAYWMDSEGNKHHFLGDPMPATGQKYEDLYVNTTAINVGLKLNIDLLQVVKKKYDRRLMFHISPMVGMSFYNANVNTLAGDKLFYASPNLSSIIVGGELALGYRITSNISVQLYSNMNWYLCNRIDGVNDPTHAGNYLIETGLKFTFHFGGNKGSKKSKSAPVYVEQPKETVVEPQPAPVVEEVVEVVEEPVVEEKKEVVIVPVIAPEDLVLETIYFGQDQAYIPNTEYEKLNDLVKELHESPESKVVIKGYANNTGNDQINLPLSVRRANNIEWWLKKEGISQDRIIKVEGFGTDKEASYTEGRRVEVCLAK